ncbi:helix-turn-helix domain-containing protein [Azospirillum halopraeferens]|uniref:helix-turn-helix domain-containing protein n=1 Tax=Azospirillum halopraeferens TaxID=34010 RepID=UPI00041C5C87|nr:helix-turn-helix domain-containing protein [Azospirillum halopraeferens]
MRSTWTTEDVREHEQFAYWRDAICDAFVPLQPEGDCGRFRGRIDSLALRAMHASVVEADAHPVHLTRQGIHRQSEVSFFANLVLEGEVMVEQFGEATRVRSGDIYLLDTASAFTVTFGSRFRIFCVTLPEHLLRHRMGALGRPATSVLRGDAGSGRIASLYMQALESISPLELADIQDMAADQLSTLIARAVSRSPDDPGGPRRNGHRTALQRILSHIDAHLADEDLSVETASRALCMSRSYLYQVLGEAGHTFAGYVRDRRLDECRRSLQMNPQASITEIAVRWGFPDQSSFSRMFKARFGKTPRAARG